MKGSAPAAATFIWFLAMMLLYVIVESATASWLPTFFERTFAVSASSAAFSLTLFWTGLAVTRFIYIFITGGSIRIQLALHIFGMVLSYVLLAFFAYHGTMRLGATFLLGLASGPIWPLIINLYSRNYTRRHYVNYLVSAGSLGALSGPIITSGFFRLFGIPAMMKGMLAFTLVMTAAFILLTVRLGRRQ